MKESFSGNFEKNYIFEETILDLKNLKNSISNPPLKPENIEWKKLKNVDKIYKDGKIPVKNRVEVGGRSFLLDEGLTFILVKKGDTRGKILRDAIKIKPGGRDFSYLDIGTNKYNSINIPSHLIPLNTWIPLPLKSSERIITDNQFYEQALKALHEISNPKNSRDIAYTNEVKELLKKVGEDKLISMIIAVAKQESGGAPLGQFVFHRWENHRKAFSHSIFHVMMEGPGSQARKKLGMTPGQMNHPKNSVKLFLAFLIEKVKERRPNSSATNTAEYLNNRINNLEDFASFYNGTNWKKTNPNYVKNLKKYIKNIGKIKENKNDEAIKASSYRKMIIKHIKKEIWANKFQPWNKKRVTSLSDKNIIKITNKIIEYLNKFNKKLNPKEQDIELTKDSKKIYIRIINKDKSLVGNGPTTVKI